MKLTTLSAVLIIALSKAVTTQAAGGPRFKFNSYPQPSPTQYLNAEALSQNSRLFGFDSISGYDCAIGSALLADSNGQAKRCAPMSYDIVINHMFLDCARMVEAARVAGSAARAEVLNRYQTRNFSNWREAAQAAANAYTVAIPGFSHSEHPIEVRAGGEFASLIPQRVISQDPAAHRATFMVPANLRNKTQHTFHIETLDVYGFHTKFLLKLRERSAAHFCVNLASEQGQLPYGILPGERLIGYVASIGFATAAVAHLRDVKLNGNYQGEANDVRSVSLGIGFPIHFTESQESNFKSQSDLFGFSVDVHQPPVPLFINIIPSR